MNKLKETILKLQGQARRLLQVTDTAIKGLPIGESLKAITPDTAHAVNNIAEEIATLTLEAIPRPKGKDPTAELLTSLEEARKLHTMRLTSDVNRLSIMQDLYLLESKIINAACVISHLRNTVEEDRIKSDAPADALTQKEKETLDTAMQEIICTGKPLNRLIEGSETATIHEEESTPYTFRNNALDNLVPHNPEAYKIGDKLHRVYLDNGKLTRTTGNHWYEVTRLYTDNLGIQRLEVVRKNHPRGELQIDVPITEAPSRFAPFTE